VADVFHGPLLIGVIAMIRTNKQKLLDLVARLPDDVSWEEVAHRLELLRHIEIARQQGAVPLEKLAPETLKELATSDAEGPPHPHFPSVT
jgi:hypothetical protein